MKSTTAKSLNSLQVDENLSDRSPERDLFWAVVCRSIMDYCEGTQGRIILCYSHENQKCIVSSARRFIFGKQNPKNKGSIIWWLNQIHDNPDQMLTAIRKFCLRDHADRPDLTLGRKVHKVEYRKTKKIKLTLDMAQN